MSMLFALRGKMAEQSFAVRFMSSPVPGILACVLISLVAVWLGGLAPVVGAPVFGIILGILAGNVLGVPALLRPGIAFCGKKVLQLAIIVLGGSLSLVQVWQTGRESLGVMIITLSAAMAGAWAIGRFLNVGRNLTSLVGVGTGICGGSAIAAVAPVIRARDEEIAFSISTVFLFNVVAVLVFPALGRLLHLSDSGFGLWAGTAVNDTSSVVAAGYSFSDKAGDLAVIVKLTRTLMIVPVTLVLAFLTSRRQARSGVRNYRFVKIFPWFVLGFVAASVLNTLLPIPGGVTSALVTVGKFMIVMAMAAIGLNTNLGKLMKNGWRPILLGLCCWIVLSAVSLAVQYAVLGL
jgi:uncharacterized integral membrane protein (TIGR00698 family)